MKIQLNTDNRINGDQQMAERVQAIVDGALERFSERLTRIEVHLSDNNSGKSGARDKRCLMEARPEGLDPVAVTAESDQIGKAIREAADKLRSALDSQLERLRPH